MKKFEIDGIGADEFKAMLSDVVRSEIEAINPQGSSSEQEVFLTREEVSNLLKINLSTVTQWSKSGVLKQYALGGRVYYLRSEIKKSLIPINHT